MKAENCLAEFMDRCFYSKLHDKSNNKIYFDRKNDKINQMKGIDVELRVGNMSYFIDEKASLYYSNAMIPTFAFEIDSVQKGHGLPVQGWFVNTELQTEYYMLIWPNIKCEKRDSQWVRKDLKDIKSTDFTIVEAILVDKKDLLLEVEKRGFNSALLIEYARRLRNQVRDNDTGEVKLDDSIKLMYSGNLAERPINAVIKKDFLKKIAKGIYLISEEGYAIVNK